MNVAVRGRLPHLLGHAGVAAVLLAVAILAIGSVASTGIAGPAPWQHVAAVRIAGEDRLRLDLWARGEDAVYVERRGPEVVSDQRCMAGTLTEWAPTGRIVRKLGDPRRCFELATDPLLGFVRAAQGPDFAPAERAEGGGATAAVFTARDAGAHLQTVVIDPIRQVPLRAVFRNGDVWTWEYVAPTDDSPPPPPAEQARTETYTDLTPEAAAPELGLTAVPLTVAGRPLRALYRYDSGAPASSDVGPPRVTSTYAIWGEAGDLEGTGQIQLIVTDYPPPPDALGIEELGGAISLRLDEGGRQVLIFAPDRATLEVAVRALRPGLKLPEAGR
jgi:hypothetical protein